MTHFASFRAFLREVALASRPDAVGDALRRLLRWAPALVLAPFALCGCATILRTFHGQDSATLRADQLQILQFRVMQFADEYAGGIIEPIQRFQEGTDNAADRLAAQNWKLSQSTAAYTIASGPNAVANTLDLTVLATLSRMVVEDAWVSERFGERATPLREAHRRLEARARDLVRGVITAEQFAQFQSIIDEWRAQNPHIRAVSYVHFSDFAKSMGQPSAGDNASAHGVLALLGIDPLSTLDPAVREVAQTRELAERTIYYAQRAPNLLDMQVERLVDQFATTPETNRLLANVDRAAGAAEATGRLASELPVLLSREREAAIRQFMKAVSVQTARMRELIIELRRTFEAGTATSSSLTTTIRSLDQWTNGFKLPNQASVSAEKARRPFDITDYTTAAAELARAANDLEQLVAGVERGMPALVQATDRAAATVQNVVDHAYWRLVQLIGLTLLGGLFAAIAYRAIARRWFA